MSNLFFERAALQTKILTGPQCHKKRLVPTAIMDEDKQKKGLHRLRHPVFTEILGEDQKKCLHRLIRPVFTEILGEDQKKSSPTHTSSFHCKC